MKIKSFISLLGLLSLFSCSDNVSILEQESTANSSFQILAGASSSSKAAGIDWNVWEVGDSVRITYKLPGENTTGTGFPFGERCYGYAASTKGLNTILTTAGTPISQGFITGDETSMYVFAYSANRFDLFDMAWNNEYYILDLSKISKEGVIANPIFAVSTRNKSDLDTTPLLLNFDHLLSQVTVTIKNYPGGSIPDDLEVYLTGTETVVKHTWMPWGSITMLTEVSSSPLGDIVYFQRRKGTDTAGDTYTFDFEGEVVPQELSTSNAVLHFKESSSTEYTLTLNGLDDFDEFEEDHRYNVEVSFPDGGGLVNFVLEAESFVEIENPGTGHTNVDEDGGLILPYYPQ